MVKRKTATTKVTQARVCLLLVVVLLAPVHLSSCVQQEADAAFENPYSQIKIELPQEVSFIAALQKTTNGKVLMLGTTVIGSAILWELNKSDSWEEISNISELLELSEYDALVATPINRDGTALCVFYNELKKEEGLKFYLVAVEPNVEYRELNIDSSAITDGIDSEILQQSIAQIVPLSDSRFLIQNHLDMLFILDCQNETLNPVISADRSAQPHISSFAELGGELYALIHEEVDGEHVASLKVVDLSTGAFVGLGESMQEELAVIFDDHEEYDYYNVNLSMEGSADQTDRITLCTSRGIFELKDDTLSHLAHAEQTVLTDPSKVVLGCVFDDNNDFFLICWNTDGSISPVSLYKYIKHDSSPDSEKTLKIYMLLDNADVRQAIALHNEKYPEVNVILEIGLSGNDANIEDAARGLSTRIIAGKGPDVLFLDGLPVEAFIEQGVLSDLTDIYHEAIATGLYYESILGSFESGGECKVIPMRFIFPVLVANKTVVDRLDSLATLDDITKEIVASNANTALFCNTQYLDDIFASFYPGIIGSGRLNAEALKQFLECAANLSNRSIENSRQENTSLGLSRPQVLLRSLLANPEQILTYQALSELELALVEAHVQHSEADLATGLLSLDQGSCFVPRSCIAINSKSNEIELAEGFVQLLLSKEYQYSNQGTGLSLMRSGLEEMTSILLIGLDEGENLIADPFSDKTTLEHYANLLSSLNTPVAIDQAVSEIIYSQLGEFLDGTISLNEAVAACEKRINLYMAEHN